MPIIHSSYKPPFYMRNGYIATIYSGIARNVKLKSQTIKRERFHLSDGDFLDLDWTFAKIPTERLVILLHGLEGDSQRSYVLGATNKFYDHDYDVLRVNYRGCSGEPNLKYESYHSGATQDLHEVLEMIYAKNTYSKIYLNGFSLGGNVILKYLGERKDISENIKAASTISVPCYLTGSAKEIVKFKNFPYAINFKYYLLKKLRQKQEQFPDKITKAEIKKIKNLIDFDHAYTSKAHGFKDAFDYYEKSSSLQFLNEINRPTLIINALNDSFLSSECYPVKIAKENPNLFLEMPKYGGHVGFYGRNYYYTEIRSLDFFSKY